RRGRFVPTAGVPAGGDVGRPPHPTGGRTARTEPGGGSPIPPGGESGPGPVPVPGRRHLDPPAAAPQPSQEPPTAHRPGLQDHRVAPHLRPHQFEGRAHVRRPEALDPHGRITPTVSTWRWGTSSL